MFNMYNTAPSLDRINAQINELEKLKTQMQQPIQQPTNLTQNFQLAPNREIIKYANNIEEVQRDLVIGDTPYFSKDMSVVWVKNSKGEIKTYELIEIVEKDEKDLQIEYLQEQIKQLKGMFENEQNVRDDDADEDEADATGNDKTIRTTSEKNKPTSIQRVSTSKKSK
ncbi:MAG: hypothetical protein J6W64_06780 [Bacilli bacterium]|nr:hypothetical protein [Bacilli bacterium]